MSVLYLLLPLALLIAALAVGVYIWAVKSGQMDDLETPPRRILVDDPPAPPEDPPAATRQDTAGPPGAGGG